MTMKSVAGIICLVKDLEKVAEFYETLGLEFKKEVPGVSKTGVFKLVLDRVFT